MFLCIIKSSLISVQDYESKEKFPIRDDRISHLLPTSYQDLIVRVYSKKPELVYQFICCLNLISFFSLLFPSSDKSQYNVQVGPISEAFENFQLKTYGIKAQVCPTPEKKKRRRCF